MATGARQSQGRVIRAPTDEGHEAPRRGGGLRLRGARAHSVALPVLREAHGGAKRQATDASDRPPYGRPHLQGVVILVRLIPATVLLVGIGAGATRGQAAPSTDVEEGALRLCLVSAVGAIRA